MPAPLPPQLTARLSSWMQNSAAYGKFWRHPQRLPRKHESRAPPPLTALTHLKRELACCSHCKQPDDNCVPPSNASLRDGNDGRLRD